jgi:excisionase family DNA binding protein
LVSTDISESRRGYRIAEAAQYMGVSPWFVEVAVREKRLPALKLGRPWVILREDMDAFLDAERQKEVLLPQQRAPA